MDIVSPREQNRAEHLQRQAAADAHESYYAHPALHMHTYRPEHRYDDPDAQPRGGVGALNAAYQEVQAAQAAAVGPTSGEIAQRMGTNEGKAEEEGGKKDAAPATGVDKGAFELGGEAHGTITSPGPSAALATVAKQAEMGRIPGATVDGAVNVPRDRLPGTGQHWSASVAMEPHLQLMCGPLISYYTTINNVWYGAALVVTADQGSIFQPAPTLSLNFSPYVPAAQAQANGVQDILPPQTIPCQNLYTYPDQHAGPCSFWRFMIEIPLQNIEMTVRYRLNRGAEIEFVVPAIGQNFYWAATSCNGFSSGVNPDEFKGDFNSGYDPLWEDLLVKHQQRPFHCMVGGGDQIYCDPITREPELQGWINAKTREEKITFEVTEEIRLAIDRFYFNHYCKIFRAGAFARANSTIPMVNMLDDHDLIDGFGTYEDPTMKSPMMSTIGSRGYFFYLLFQVFTNDAVDGTNGGLGQLPIKSMLIGSPGAFIPYPGHSLCVYLGPKVYMVALDCRAERTKHQVCTAATYDKVFAVMAALAPQVEQFVLQLGVPIAYPRMSFVEHFLEFKYNPLTMLARRNALGLGGLVNKFDKEGELLDDLNDHWCSKVHKKERNWLVVTLQEMARKHTLRVTFLSGDVHLAAVGCLFTKHAKRHHLEPAQDHRYMLNIISSAIVNTPPPAAVAGAVGFLSSNKHRTLHKHKTDETALKVFQKDTDGSDQRRPYVMARRNYCIADYNQAGELVFDIRVEKKQGAGETVSYPVPAPPPAWGPAGATTGAQPQAQQQMQQQPQMAQGQQQQANAQQQPMGQQQMQQPAQQPMQGQQQPQMQQQPFAQQQTPHSQHVQQQFQQPAQQNYSPPQQNYSQGQQQHYSPQQQNFAQGQQNYSQGQQDFSQGQQNYPQAQQYQQQPQQQAQQAYAQAQPQYQQQQQAYPQTQGQPQYQHQQPQQSYAQ